MRRFKLKAKKCPHCHDDLTFIDCIDGSLADGSRRRYSRFRCHCSPNRMISVERILTEPRENNEK